MYMYIYVWVGVYVHVGHTEDQYPLHLMPYLGLKILWIHFLTLVVVLSSQEEMTLLSVISW